jgi:hypothetical protein
MTIRSLAWLPISGSEKSCIVSAAGEAGAHGKIISNTCPTTLDVGQTIDISVTCKNDGTASGSFALLFCSSTPPFVIETACNVLLYGSEAFTLDPEATKDITIPTMTMPNSQVLYVAVIQHANPPESLIPWVTDETVPCSINLPGAPPVAQGKIITHDCPESVAVGQLATIKINYENIGLASGLFRLLFCASLPPATDCSISQPVPEEFTLNPSMSKDINIYITMPNNAVSYTANVQHKDILDGGIWTTDDTVYCDIGLTSPPVAEAGGSGILVLGLAVSALGMMMSKKK